MESLPLSSVLPTATPTDNRRRETIRGGRTQLLVSVRNRTEAALARRAGVDWIDLKEPNSGPLGAPELAMAREVAELLHDFPSRSVALGELQALLPDRAAELARGFPFAKVGLAGQAARAGWQRQLSELAQRLQPATQLVPVIYADCARCDAPPSEAILQIAREMRAAYLLIDTFVKDGRGLLDCFSVAHLREVIEAASQFGCATVVAGSLREQDLASVLALPVVAVAVRGAVCAADRRGSLCLEKLAHWVSCFSGVR